MLSDELVIPLQALEYKLRSEYTVLLSEGRSKDKNEDAYYNILDGLIKIRSEIATLSEYRLVKTCYPTKVIGWLDQIYYPRVELSKS